MCIRDRIWAFHVYTQKIRAIFHMLFCFPITVEKREKLLIRTGQSRGAERGGSVNQMGSAGSFDGFSRSVHEVMPSSAMGVKINESRRCV